MLSDIKDKIEEIRKIINEIIANDRYDSRVYQYSIELDKLINQYIDSDKYQ